MTELMYTEHPYLFESSAHITHCGSDAKGMYLVLNQSLFYPQGGGQPADQGVIISANVSHKVLDVRRVDSEVRHYITDKNTPLSPGCTVTVKIDKDRRLLNAQYHTAGHLIASVVEKIYPTLKAIKGHQFPGEAYVEFDGTVSDVDNFMTQVASNVLECVSRKLAVKTEELNPDHRARIAEYLPYELPQDKPLRVCHIQGFSPVPCGGTHVETLSAVASLSLKKCKSKKQKTKIYYEVE